MSSSLPRAPLRLLTLGSTLLLVLSAAPIFAASNAIDTPVTFHRDVLPIFQENCQSCHRPSPAGVGGMVAPMALTTYDEARPWAKRIAQVVEAREMPPWDAAKELHGVFGNERVLSDAEIATVVRWARAGAPEGNPTEAPPARELPNQKWWLGEPDLVLPLPEPVWVGDEVEDWQPMFEIPLTEEILPEDRWLRAIECVAGSDVVHHIVVFAHGPGMDRDRGDGGVGGNLGGLAPGAEPDHFDDGYGILLKRGTTLAVSMHYHKETGAGTGAWDQSEVGLHFYPRDAEVRNVQISPIGNLQFEIPPGHPSWKVGMSRVFERPVTVFSMLPHMHFRGAAATYSAYYPDGGQEVLLDVPTYDYAWQHSYRFAQPRQLPAGTRVDVSMTFDNSSGNPANPDPSKAIRFGGPTTDEMALGWMYYVFDDEQASRAAAYHSGPSSAGGK